MLGRVLVAIALLAGAAHAAQPAATTAAPAPTNAREAVVIFAKVCVNTLGREAKMDEELAKLNKAGIANKLKPDAAAKVVPESQKDDAWILVSPETKQQLMITHDTIGICGMRVRAADEKAIVAEYEGLVNAFATEAKGTIKAKGPMKTTEGTIYYKEVKTTVGPIFSIALSTSPKTAATGTQHMLTFARASGN